MYKRRLEALAQKGKAGDEVTVTEAKRDRARDRFEVVDANAKDMLLKAKVERDEVLETATITVAACQLELMYMTANYLEEAIIAFPKHKARARTARPRRTRLRPARHARRALCPLQGVRAHPAARDQFGGSLAVSFAKRAALRERPS